MVIAAVIAAGCSPAEEAAVPVVSSANASEAEAGSPSEGSELGLVESGSLLAQERWDVIDRLAGLEGFGGTHLDAAQGLVFSVTPDAVEEAKRILHELPPDGPWTLREVRWSLRQLERDLDAVHDAGDDLAQAGLILTATSISHSENMLTLHVEGDRALAMELLAELVTSEFSVVGPLRATTDLGTID